MERGTRRKGGREERRKKKKGMKIERVRPRQKQIERKRI